MRKLRIAELNGSKGTQTFGLVIKILATHTGVPLSAPLVPDFHFSPGSNGYVSSSWALAGVLDVIPRPLA